MRSAKLLSLLTFFSIILIISCGGPDKNAPDDTVKKLTYDKTNLDSSFRPGDDFFHFANNGWLKRTEIPGTEGVWGTFSVLKDEVTFKQKSIAEDASSDKNASKGSNKQLVGDFYSSGMDSVAIEKQDFDPIKGELDMIREISDKKMLARELAHLHSHFVFGLFSMYVTQDARHSDMNIPILSQGGLGLPERDYYFRNDSMTKNIREKYVLHVRNQFMNIGDTDKDAQKKAEGIMKLEIALAKASWNVVQNRDPQKTYNKKKLTELNKLCAAFNWVEFFEMVGVKGIDSVIVSQPSFFTGFNSIINSTSLDDIKNYLAYCVIDDASTKLGSNFENENFDFYERTINGVNEMKPRWKRILAATDRAIGDALGQLFVEKYFTAEAKKKVNEMVDNLLAVYKERIDSRDWMSDSTKVMAKKKIEKIMKKLGYTDKWKDYSSLEISRASYATNSWNAAEYGYKFMINKLGKPVDRTEWGMTPPTINAYYNPSMNEIVFPAGIMQIPFFDLNQDDALNYGAMGSVIGHELTHGFDDQGSLFNAEGNMVNWWTNEDHKKFEEKTGRIVKQFNAFVAIDTLHVNGQLTLGENIADLGGMTISYYAFKRSREGKKSDTIDGFTPEQRFFLGWARGWCVKFKPEFLRKQVLTNEHAPGNFRVIGPLSNMQEFYDAFNVKEGDKMYIKPEDRALIW